MVEKEVILCVSYKGIFPFMTLSPKGLQAPSHWGFDFNIGILVGHKYSVYRRSLERQEERVGDSGGSLGDNF